MRQVNLLVVLDGFGYNTDSDHNAIALAKTPIWNHLWREHPRTLISGSGEAVGLPPGQMGNSEVGHMNLGAGRIVYQDFTRINRAIDQGEFVKNHGLNAAFKKLDQSGGALHVMGLLSPGGVHSHEQHIFELIKHAAQRGIAKIYLHAFLDGRDTPPRSAEPSIRAAEDLFAALGVGQVVSIIGRYYAMDRDNRWDRIERAYNLIVRGEAPFHAKNGLTALGDAYKRDEDDEFIQPTAIHGPDSVPVSLEAEDAVIFMNFRSDRARQLTRAMTQVTFESFKRRSFVPLTEFVTLTRYAQDIELTCAFDQQKFSNTLGEYISALGLHQLRIAETEKYAHVTFFFSGGTESTYPGENRILVNSPDVATYDLQPEMSAHRLTDKLIEAIGSGQYDLIVCNYANGDMVGHTGQLNPAIAAVETLDVCLGRLIEAINQSGGQMLITADHGNVEQMHDQANNQPHTAHTHNPVPLVYVGPSSLNLADSGRLADVAPTLLNLMGLEIPAEMTGQSLAMRHQPDNA